jgi:hypothetical protein
VCGDHRGARGIAARQAPAFRRHREHQRGRADQNVVKVHVIHRRCDAFGNDFLVQALRGRVVRFHVPVDDPRETPVVVFAFLHHDPVQLRSVRAELDEAADHVGEPFNRFESVGVLLCEREIRGLVCEQRFDRGLPQHFLRAEVIGDEPAVHARFGLDLACTDGVVAALCEQRNCGLQQLVAGGLRAFLHELAFRDRHWG